MNLPKFSEKHVHKVRYNVVEVIHLKSIHVTNARLYSLIDETNKEHEPIQILSKRGNAIIISEKDWNAIQETLYLLSIPGMRESIVGGMTTPVDECVEELNW